MYRKILAPMDGSDLAECTLTHVIAVAGGCQVPEVDVLKVVEPLKQTYELTDDFVAQVMEMATTDAKEYVAKVADTLRQKGLVVKTTIVNGEAAEEILNYAKKNKVDLIVMASHGRSGVTRWTLGSVADRVLRHSPVPVMVVSPPGCRDNKVYKVGFEAA